MALALSGSPLLAQQEPAFEGKTRTVVVLPRGDLYPPHLAGPHQRGNAVTFNWITHSTAPEFGNPAFGLKLGARFGIVRSHPNGHPDLGWQISFDAGFFGQFDIENNYDNLGWDGFYGLAFTSSLGPKAALEIGALHTSGHIGDEYIERNGRERLNYTRTELAVGLDLAFARRWRTYGQLAYGFELDNDLLQAPARAQAGLEYEASNSLWGERFGWYAALDLSSFEERDWQPDISMALGLMARTGASRWRLGVEYYDGRVPLGEFFLEDQRHISIGLYMEINASRTAGP